MRTEKGEPVLVGVDRTLGKDKKEHQKDYNEKTTDHYVIVVGRKCERGNVVYQYWDVGSVNGDKDDLLFEEFINGLRSLKTYSNKKYTVTQIRRNI